jgi:hypothetical protein
MAIKYPTGYPMAGRTKIAVNFPSQLFVDIIAMAKREKVTFNDMVVTLCKVGKLDLEESDALEPDTSDIPETSEDWFKKAELKKPVTPKGNPPTKR